VYAGSQDHHVYALDAKSGALRWEHDVGGVVLGAPSVVGRTVYFAVIGPNIGTFGFRTGSGKLDWKHELGEYNPVISDGERLYLTGSSQVRAFQPMTRRDRKRRRERLRQEERRRERRQAQGGRNGSDQRK
jgi:outer membrane protein assembly factor BamB